MTRRDVSWGDEAKLKLPPRTCDRQLLATHELPVRGVEDPRTHGVDLVNPLSSCPQGHVVGRALAQRQPVSLHQISVTAASAVLDPLIGRAVDPDRPPAIAGRYDADRPVHAGGVRDACPPLGQIACDTLETPILHPFRRLRMEGVERERENEQHNGGAWRWHLCSPCIPTKNAVRGSETGFYPITEVSKSSEGAMVEAIPTVIAQRRRHGPGCPDRVLARNTGQTSRRTTAARIRRARCRRVRRRRAVRRLGPAVSARRRPPRP